MSDTSLPQVHRPECGLALHWVQALRGRSVLFTRAEALAILGPHWADVIPEVQR